MAAKKLLLIDGHSIATRAFYGLPPLTNSEGLHTNAVLGFLNIFFNNYSAFAPDHIVVAFDMKQKTFRHKMFDAYKGTRKGLPDELHEQIPVLRQVLSAMQIKTVTAEGFEADDILGTLARRGEEAGMDVIILSGDRDLLQLATEKTMIAIPKTTAMGSETYTYFEDDVKEQYKVTPKEFIDVKALMGDASDNIPGIPGIGEKRATDLIIKYGSIEEAIKNVDEITPPKVRESLSEYREQGIMSKELATIIRDVPLDLDFEDCRIDEESAFYNNESYNLFKKLELKRLLSRFDENEIIKEDVSKTEYEEKPFSEFKAIVSELNKRAGFFIDNDAALMALACDDKTYIFTLKDADKNDIKKEIISFFDSDTEICVFGLKDMLHTLDVSDAGFKNIYDIQIMAYLLDPLKNDYPYDNISQIYLSEIIPSKEDLLKKESIKDSLSSDAGADAAKIVAAYSAQTAYRACDVLSAGLKEEGMDELFFSVEMPLLYSIYNMEKEGIGVESDILKEISKKLDGMIEESSNEIFKEAGCEFNINSPKQLGNILFETMHLPYAKKTKTGYSTSADVLEKLALEYPFVEKILEYRSAMKLKSNYADGLIDFISDDKRIHGRFNQTVTATGRISSSDPNLQNIPTRTELGQEIRKAFVAKAGHVFLDADYSQIELRLLAHLSADENLIEAYKSDVDIHKVTASKVFKVPLDEVTKEQRRNAKAVNFGIVYGISSFGLSQDLSISRNEASEYIKQYFETYPKVKEFLDNTVKRAKIDGFTKTMFGRIRPLPELSSSNGAVRAFGERAAMNAPIQGSAADIIKIAMINVDKKLREKGLMARIVLQVHDELLVEAPEDEADEARKIIIDEMKNAASLKVPLEVECNKGHDWNEAH